MLNYPENDLEFEETTVTKVDVAGEHSFGFTVAAGWSFGAPRADVIAAGLSGVFVGDKIRTYGRGFGSPVRGLFVNGRRIYYRTPSEQDAEHQRQLEEGRNKKQTELDATRIDRDARRAKLPPLFRERLDGMERRAKNWRRDHETYELFTCEQAVVIAEAIHTADDLEVFRTKPFEEQGAAVPGLDDGHSGNTFGMSVRLAYWSIVNPQNIPLEHAGICSLVGCDEAGCSSSEKSAS